MVEVLFCRMSSSLLSFAGRGRRRFGLLGRIYVRGLWVPISTHRGEEGEKKAYRCLDVCIWR